MKLAVAIMLCAVGLAAAQPRGPKPPPLPPLPEEPEMQAAVSEKVECGTCQFLSKFDVSLKQCFWWIKRGKGGHITSCVFLTPHARQPTPPSAPTRRPQRTPLKHQHNVLNLPLPPDLRPCSRPLQVRRLRRCSFRQTVRPMFLQ